MQISKSTCKIIWRDIILMTVALFMCTSCISTDTVYQQHEAMYQDEAGAVLTSVVGVTPWQDVKAELQPKFAIDETTALKESIPTTIREQEQLINAIRTAFKLALPTNSFSKTTDYALAIGEQPKQSESQHTGKKSGDVSQIQDNDPFSIGDKTTPTPQLGGELGRDPLMTRRNAAALLQAVRLMNRSVEDAVICRDYVPYVVTLQISLMPFARNEPYDVFSVISFFPGRAGNGGHVQPKAPPTGAASPQMKNPIVLPILVTDNLEAASQSRSLNNILMVS